MPILKSEQRPFSIYKPYKLQKRTSYSIPSVIQIMFFPLGLETPYCEGLMVGPATQWITFLICTQMAFTHTATHLIQHNHSEGIKEYN